MAKRKRKLPDFSAPPVAEVVIGVQFYPIQNFSVVHHGLYYQRIKDEYPLYEIRPPLQIPLERFEEESTPEAGFKFSNIPPLRSWFVDQKGNRLVQLQKEHFIHNWRKVKGSERYPRYEKIRKGFVDLWKDFLLFSEEYDLGEVKPNQWEVTYVNHLVKEHEWNSLVDLKNIFPCWTNDSSENYLPTPEDIDLNLSYIFPEKRGRLHLSLSRGLRASDNADILLLKLIARGRLDSSDPKTLLESFNLGREWIVKGFTDFTSRKVHHIWKRKA